MGNSMEATPRFPNPDGQSQGQPLRKGPSGFRLALRLREGSIRECDLEAEPKHLSLLGIRSKPRS